LHYYIDEAYPDAYNTQQTAKYSQKAVLVHILGTKTLFSKIFQVDWSNCDSPEPQHCKQQAPLDPRTRMRTSTRFDCPFLAKIL